MPPRAPSGNCVWSVVAVVSLCVLLVLNTSAAQQLNPESSEPEALTALVVLGLRNTVNEQVEEVVSDEFAAFDVQLVPASEAGQSTYEWPDVDVIIAAGKEGCEIALQGPGDIPVQCTLLTEEGFRSLVPDGLDLASRLVSALVVDQPVQRQAVIASRVYPSLSRFSLLSPTQTLVDALPSGPSVDLFQYQTAIPLATQLGDSLRAHDALIAISESDVFNRSTLQTVLLTAYGFGKPVIGFSRAYVKAGALITGYSTPAQILRQIANAPIPSEHADKLNDVITYPDYFSVVDNPSVARSLGLLKVFSFAANQTYTDADFVQ